MVMNDNSKICKRVRSIKIEPLGKCGEIESLKKNNMTDIEIVKINKKMEEWNIKAMNMQSIKGDY